MPTAVDLRGHGTRPSNAQRNSAARETLLSITSSALQSLDTSTPVGSSRASFTSRLFGGGGDAAMASAERTVEGFTLWGRHYVWPWSDGASFNPFRSVVAVGANQIAGKVGGLAVGVNTPIDTASGFDLAVGGALGTAQGVANSVNGVQDALIGTLNIPSAVLNGGLYALGAESRLPYIPSPDWSENLITQESTHNLSKFLGGNGLVTLATVGWSQLGGAGTAAKSAAAASTRQRVLANIAESQQARASSSFAVSGSRTFQVSVPRTTVPRTGPQGVVPGRHNANVQIRGADGTLQSHARLVSGSQTPEELALGFPKGMLASHTEARAVRGAALGAGDRMIITGQLPPCPTCKGAMNQAVRDTGAEIIYRWRENGVTRVWTGGN